MAPVTIDSILLQTFQTKSTAAQLQLVKLPGSLCPFQCSSFFNC